MRAVVERSMSQSAAYFREHVWPLFSERVGGGRLIPVESVTDSYFARLLDTQAGIDAWQVVLSGGIRGIASRVQLGDCWASWTVRTRVRSGNPTERDKLIHADMSLLRPSLHIQAYTRAYDAPPSGAACILTTDLVRLIMAGAHGPEKRNPADGNCFIPVWWESAEAEGYRVWRAP